MATDADLLALLEAVPNLRVHVGKVDVDEAAKVIDVPLPYVVYNSSPGFDINERFSGGAGSRVKEFDLKGVGESEEQALAVLDRARSAVNRKRVNRALIKRTQDNQRVRREDELTRPGGEPLFFGVDRYAVGS